MESGRNESLVKRTQRFHGLKSNGAVELFALGATSGDPSESRLFLVAPSGVGLKSPNG